MDPNKFWVINGGFSVEVSDVEGVEFGIVARENTVDHEHDKFQSNCFDADIKWVADLVVTYSYACMNRASLFMVNLADNFGVQDFLMAVNGISS